MTKPPRGRPPVEQQRLRDGLLDRLASGRYAPGSRIPTYSELMTEFGCTRTTVCAAINTLVESAHLETRGRHGTFVSRAPPCRSRLALLLPRAENEDAGFSCFWRSLADAASELDGADGCTIEVFTGPQIQAGSPSYLRLLRELEQRLVGGLIIVATPPMYFRTPVYQAAVPQVYVSGGSYAGHLCVGGEAASFRRAMIAGVAGCRRPIALGGAQRFANREECAAWLAAARTAGLELREDHLLGVELTHPVMATRLVRLLCQAGADQRPDGLIVADDNLLEACQQGLADAGLAIGRDIRVVSHLNLPTRLRLAPQVRLVTYDTRQLLRTAVGLIRDRQEGRGPAEILVEIPAGDGPADA